MANADFEGIDCAVPHEYSILTTLTITSGVPWFAPARAIHVATAL